MVLKAWLSGRSPAEQQALERFLPEKERHLLQGFSPFETEITSEKYGTLGAHKVHWSWFIPTIKLYNARDQKLFISSLDTHSAEQLKSVLNLKTPLEPVTEMGKAYLQTQLMRSIAAGSEPVLPPEFLPASPLNCLLMLGKKELIRLINLLSLYDLSIELRQIVETKTLKKIYSFLNKEHQAALKTISAKVPEAHPLPKMGLDREWDGTEEALHVLLHRRGLTRLGLALSGQHPDLIWTICHHLDIGRGGSLAKLCGKEPIAGMSETAVHQVIDSIHLLLGKESSKG